CTAQWPAHRLRYRHADRDHSHHRPARKPASERCLDRIDKAERVVPQMQATIEFVSGYVRQRVNQLALAQPVSYVMHAQLIPSFYLERIARSQTVSHGKPLQALAIRLRTPLWEPGGALSQLCPETQNN